MEYEGAGHRPGFGEAAVRVELVPFAEALFEGFRGTRVGHEVEEDGVGEGVDVGSDELAEAEAFFEPGSQGLARKLREREPDAPVRQDDGHAEVGAILECGVVLFLDAIRSQLIDLQSLKR